MPNLEQMRDGAAAGREAGKNISRVVLLLATIGAVAAARVLQHYGWGFWQSVIACAIGFGIAIGVFEGLRLRRQKKA